MIKVRAAGVLAHVTSLPSPGPIGDLGSAATAFIDALAEGGQRVWQVLPLTPTDSGVGHSPYSSSSVFAMNPLLISAERLKEEGVKVEIEQGSGDRVDFGAAVERSRRLIAAAEACRNSRKNPWAHGIEAFRAHAASWLEPWVAFQVLKERLQGAAWWTWPEEFRSGTSETIQKVRQSAPQDWERHVLAQFLVHRHWSRVREHGRARGVLVMGDAPIYVSHDSAEVWARRDLFLLDQHGTPTAVAGVPPDYFSPEGQRWGNPLYAWDAMKAESFDWWVRRLRVALETVDILRIDHFRGFSASWHCPAGESSAKNGQWIENPGDALFEAVHRALPGAALVAEDLGVITPQVRELLGRWALPGMRVMHFAFGGDARDVHLPHMHAPNMVVYTGTHDNDTTRGWFAALDGDTKNRVQRYAGLELTDESAALHIMRMAFASVANLAIVPVQDLLNLGSEHRMNQPGTAGGNWSWRLPQNWRDGFDAGRLRQLTDTYGRL